MDLLDYEIFRAGGDGEWQVWTPDETGACIGWGAAKTTAIQNTIDNLTNTTNMLRGELEALTQ